MFTGKPAAGIYGGLHQVKLIISELTRLDAPPIADDGEAPAQGGAETSGQLAPNEVVEIDEWILDFAALFREHLGIDAEAHLDLHAEVRGSNPGPIYIDRTLPFFFFLFFSVPWTAHRLSWFALDTPGAMTRNSYYYFDGFIGDEHT